MKKTLIIALIAAFLFPLSGYAAPAPTVTQTAQVDTIDINSPDLKDKSLSGKKTAVFIALTGIYSQLAKISLQTQSAITQLSANGFAVSEAQTDLIAANASLAKAKADIATFNAINTKPSSNSLELMKTSANTAERNLRDAKTHLLESLTTLKASVTNL